MAAEVFGGSMTEHFNPLMYGSVREVFIGLLRSLPDEDVPGLPVRARRLGGCRGWPGVASVAHRLCEVAGMLAEQTGAPAAVAGPALLPDRPLGRPRARCGRGRRDEIPLAMRIVHVATDAALQRHLGGTEHAVGLVGERAGHAFDPEVAACLVEGGAEILRSTTRLPVWDEALAVEPSPPLTLAGRRARRALAAMGRFADLISPSTSAATRRASPSLRRPLRRAADGRRG